MARSALRAALVTATAATIATAAVAVATPSAPAGGHGALKTALIPTAPSFLDDQCQAASTGATQGFAVLNAPGKPGSAPKRVLGTVSLKKAPQHDTTFSVQLATGGTCTDTGAKLVTNNVGNGTAHFAVALPTGSTANAFYVVLQAPNTGQTALITPTLEFYASQAVTLS
jgi:hypothetical protein